MLFPWPQGCDQEATIVLKRLVYGLDVYFGRVVWVLQPYPISTAIAPRFIYDCVLVMEFERDAVVFEPLPLNFRNARHSSEDF